MPKFRDANVDINDVRKLAEEKGGIRQILYCGEFKG